MLYIKYFSDISINDMNLVGEKNAYLGQMITNLSSINIPQGFAITIDAYWHFLNSYNLISRIKDILNKIDIGNISNVQETGSLIRSLILTHEFSDDLIKEIEQAYNWLSNFYNIKNIDTAVRSSGIYLNHKNLKYSFIGQQESYLNVKNIENVISAVKKCMTSLFTDRSILYREQNKIDHFDVGISVSVQKMVRSDKAVSGIIFTSDTETGLSDIVIINSSYGLGKNIVRGLVNPDEYQVHKATLLQGYKPIVKKFLGTKERKLIYNKNSIKDIAVSYKDRNKFSLSDNEIIYLAKSAISIEEYYSKLYDKYIPVSVEWAKDGFDNNLYIVESRKEIFKNKIESEAIEFYKLKSNPKPKILLAGLSIGRKIASGKARILKSIKDAKDFKAGEILIANTTDPDWSPIMEKAAAVITDQGGRTCHAAVISRDLGVPALVGTLNATTLIKTGDLITVDCSQGATGYVYDQVIAFTVEKINLNRLPNSPVDLFINISDPNRAYELSFLPIKGVGLIRAEFIITNSIKIHPLAILYPEKIKNRKKLFNIYKYAVAYKNLESFFIQVLAQNIGQIAAAFYPKPVTLRFTDLKSSEYRDLLGGIYFEPKEENPMLGLRGVSRYSSKDYAPAFILECKALKIVRDLMGFKNLKVMVPFVRTVQEAEIFIEILKNHGLNRFDDELKIFMMCEIPSNILLFEEFSKYFDGFSLGSNDLTQLILGVDRDSAKLAYLFNERDLAVKKMMKYAIEKAKETKSYITICGQAPSDYPEIDDFLIINGIDSISLNPDFVIPFLLRYKSKKIVI